MEGVSFGILELRDPIHRSFGNVESGSVVEVNLVFPETCDIDFCPALGDLCIRITRKPLT